MCCPRSTSSTGIMSSPQCVATAPVAAPELEQRNRGLTVPMAELGAFRPQHRPLAYRPGTALHLTQRSLPPKHRGRARHSLRRVLPVKRGQQQLFVLWLQAAWTVI